MRRAAIEGKGRSGLSLAELNDMLASLEGGGAVRRGFNATKQWFQRMAIKKADWVELGSLTEAALSAIEWDNILDKRRAIWFAEQTALAKEFKAQDVTDQVKAEEVKFEKAEEAKAEVKAVATEAVEKHKGVAQKIVEHTAMHLGQHLMKEGAVKIFEKGMEKLQERAATGEEGRKSTAEVAAEVASAAKSIDVAVEKLNDIQTRAKEVLDKWNAALPTFPPAKGKAKIAKSAIRSAMLELERRVKTGATTQRSVAALDASIMRAWAAYQDASASK